MGDLKTSIIIDLVNRVSEPAKRIGRSLSGIAKVAGPAMADVRKRFGEATREVALLGAKLTALGVAGVWMFKRQFVDTAAQFEQFRAVLETVEGSSNKARKSLAWVSDFATKTPYELAEITEAFVRLRAYGMDPMKGLLTSLGDTASAMGKPLMQTVEAIADAITGEYERLKEFGIKAETRGNKVRFSYTDAQGQQRYATVDKRNRKIIESTLRTIWNEKYAGAMDRQSRTWRGMVSNLSDQWTRFKVAVMEAGLFDWMKGKLGDLLALVDRMAANGSLQRLAALWGDKLKAGMEKAWRAGQKIYGALERILRVVDRVANAIGGYDRLLIAVTATMGVKALLAVVNLGASLFTLGAKTLPVAISAFGLLGKAIFAVNAAAVALNATLAAGALGAMGVAAIPAILAIAGTWASNKIGGKVGGEQIRGASTERLEESLAREATTGGGLGSRLAQQIAYELAQRKYANQAAAEGHLTITLDNRNRMRVERLEARGLRIDVDTGFTMRGPR